MFKKGGIMLGDPIGYAQGSVVSSRVLEPIENEVNLEISFQGRGEILGFPFADMGTCRLVFRSDGMIHAKDGNIVMFGLQGETARVQSSGLGRLCGPVPQGRYTSTGTFETSANCWKPLNELIGIFEFIVNEQGEYKVTIWAWK